jgi:hypothetical protein
MLENRVLRRILAPKWNKVRRECRKLHNEEIHNLYSSQNIIRQIKSRRMMWVGHVARTGKERKAFRFMVGKPEGKRPLEKPRSKWEDGVEMDFKKTGWEGVEGIHLAQDRDRWRAVVNTVVGLWVLGPRS